MSPQKYPGRRYWKSDFDHAEHKRLPRDDLRRYIAMSGCRVDVMGTESARPRYIVIPDCDAQLNGLEEGLRHARINTIATDFEGCNATTKILRRVAQLQEAYPLDWREHLDVEPNFPLNYRELLSDGYFNGKETLTKARVLSIGNCEGMAAVVDFWRTSSITKPLYDYISCKDNGQRCLVLALSSEKMWWNKTRMYETYNWGIPKSWWDIQKTDEDLSIDNLKLKPNLVGFTGIELAKISGQPEWMSRSNQQFEYIENMRDPLDYIYYCALDVALPQLQLAREYSYRHRYACDFINPESSQQVWQLLEDERWGNIQPAYITDNGFRDMRESERKWLKRWLRLSEAHLPNQLYPRRFHNKRRFCNPLCNAYVVDPYTQELHPITDIDLEAENALWPQLRVSITILIGNSATRSIPTCSTEWTSSIWTWIFISRCPRTIGLRCNMSQRALIKRQSVRWPNHQRTRRRSIVHFVTDDFLQTSFKTKIPPRGSIREAHELRYQQVAEQNPLTLPTKYIYSEILGTDVHSRNTALYRTEQRRQDTRNAMRPEAERLDAGRIRTRVERNMKPFLNRIPSAVTPADKGPTYGPRCALPRQSTVPSTAACEQFLEDERLRRSATADDAFRGASRAKSVLRDNRPSYVHRQRRIKPSKYAPDPDIGLPGSCSWEGPTNCGRNRDPTAGRSTSPMIPLMDSVVTWQAQSRRRSPSPTNPDRRGQSMHQPRLVQFNYDDDDAGSTDEAIAQTMAMSVGTVPLSPDSTVPVSSAATDDSDCIMVADNYGHVPTDATSQQHPPAQPVVDISDPTHHRVLPVSDLQRGLDGSPSDPKAAKLVLPRRPLASRRGRGRGRGKHLPGVNEQHQNPGTLTVITALPTDYSQTVVRGLDNAERIDEHEYELTAANTRLEQLERNQQQLIIDNQRHQAAYQILLTHAERQNNAQPALVASDPLSYQPNQLQLSMTPSQLMIAGPVFNQPAAPPSQYVPAQPMQVDDPNQPGPSRSRHSVQFMPIEPAPVTAIPRSTGAIRKTPRSILRQSSQSLNDDSTMPSTSQPTIIEVSSTSHGVSPSSMSSLSLQQQPGPVPSGASALEALQQALPVVAPANPRYYQDACVQAEEAESIYPTWYQQNVDWPADPSPHHAPLFDLHQKLVDGPMAFDNLYPHVPVLRYFVYSGPAPDGDATLPTPVYMERIGRIVALQIRDLAYARFGTGMITPAELFNILLNANICFEHRFRAHVQPGYQNSLAYAACLQAYRIKVHLVKAIVSN